VKKINKIHQVFLIFLFCSCEKKEDVFLADSNTEISVIGRFSEKEVLQIAKSRSDTILRGLEPKYDPYTGYDSIPEKCQKKNLPSVVFSKTQKGFYYLISLYSSEHKVIGWCLDAEKLLKTQYVIIFCKKSGYIGTGKYFYSDKEKWELEPKIKCP
jgi:hypothetical protein